ncbi:MAG: hypothetical protein OXC92_03670 [Flavobacteriaceae bacterium]|nr:hypothetical protein [Flavobacteriaceae bacterium]
MDLCDLFFSNQTQRHLIHRLREAMAQEIPLFEGKVEVDESFMGDYEKTCR